MTAPLPLCVVGAGMIGMRHVEVAQACDTVRLTAVVEAGVCSQDEVDEYLEAQETHND